MLSDSPKISVVTVVRNGEQYIKHAIESVLKQNIQNIEYIIVDGKSNDKTLSIVESYASAIDLVISEPDHGIYDAMNKGIQKATGDFIVLLNSDDAFTSNAIALFHQEYIKSNQKKAIYYGDANLVFEKANYWRYKKSTMALNFRMSLFHQAMFIPKEIYQQIGLYNTHYKISADYEFSLRAKTKEIPFIHIPYALVNFTVREDQASVKYREVSSNEDYQLMKTHMRKIGILFYYLNKARENIRSLCRRIISKLIGIKGWEYSKRKILSRIFR